MAFSLDAAMDAFMASMVEEDSEGNYDLKDEHDEKAFIAMGNFHEQVQNMTNVLYQILLRNYEQRKEEDEDE